MIQSNPVAIREEKLSRDFGRTNVLKDLPLSIESGSVCALLGTNCAGKTTLVKLLMGLIQPTSGGSDVLQAAAWPRGAEMLQKTGCLLDGFARHLVNELMTDPEHEAWHQLPSILSHNRQNEDPLRLMAESDDSKLQLLTLRAIERHPIRNRVELLNGFMSAEASAVREAAIGVKQRLDELQQRQVTPRASL